MVYVFRRHMPWITTLFVGLTLVAAGLFFVIEGLNTRDEVKQQLVDEQITTTDDSAIPGVPVNSAATAKAQADAIKSHTLGRWGPYSQLDREDPRRASTIDGVALRTALNLAVVGFGVTDLVIGAGIIILIAGVASVALGTPTVYYMAGLVVPRVDRQQ